MRLEPGWARSKPPAQPIELQLIEKIANLYYTLQFYFEKVLKIQNFHLKKLKITRFSF